MSKTFTYTKTTGHYFCIASDEWEEDGVDFDYEVEDRHLLPKIVDLLFNDYFGDDKVICESEERTKEVKERLTRLVEESDLIGTFADQYEDTLKDIFETKALEMYNN
jgi:hypothetical protein